MTADREKGGEFSAGDGPTRVRWLTWAALLVATIVNGHFLYSRFLPPLESFGPPGVLVLIERSGVWSEDDVLLHEAIEGSGGYVKTLRTSGKIEDGERVGWYVVAEARFPVIDLHFLELVVESAFRESTGGFEVTVRAMESAEFDGRVVRSVL